MNVHWATNIRGEGNAFGYTIQDVKCKEAFLNAGGELDNGATIAVHVASGFYYRRIPDKFNVFFTNTEMPELADYHIKAARDADAIVVTSSWQKPVFEKYVDCPVYVCHLGVDTQTFTFHHRPTNPRTFTFLWLGAPNARKGWELVMHAWQAFQQESSVRLYMKTTMTEKYVEQGNVIWDSRRLPVDELVSLYHMADCFLFPSFGEGFGLTLAEAMSTGLPCIYTPYTAMNDLLDASTGYPLKYKIIDVYNKKGKFEHTFAQADTDDLVDKMIKNITKHGEALRRGKRASEKIRKKFTWKHTGERLMNILHDIERKHLWTKTPAMSGIAS